MVSRAVAVGIVGVAALGALATGCGHTTHVAAKPSPTVTPPSPVQRDLQARAAKGAALHWTGTYSVHVANAPDTKIRVYVRGRAYHVDVIEGAITATLYGTSTGAVACPEETGKPTVCYKVAAAGQPIPARFDAGIERVFTTDLPNLAAHPEGFAAEAEPALAARGAIPAAHCFRLTGTSTVVDIGEYCLSATGLPVRLTFPSGTLTLIGHGAAPTAEQLTPPSKPRPLPANTT